MAELINTCTERESLGGGRYRQVSHIKPVAFRDGSRLKRIKPDWIGSGLSARPHLIDEAPMIVSANNRGLRRVYPTRDMNVWVEIGAPRIQSGTRLQNMIRGNVRRKGIGLSWADSRMNTITQMGGHFLEMKTELLNGWTPPGGKIAYEFKTRGLTRKGDVLYADGKPVMHLQQPVMTDLANDEGDTRPIKYEYVELGGKLHLVYVLPDLAGMKRPCVDPTLTLQPDAAAGKDALVKDTTGVDTNYGVHALLNIGNAGGAVNYRTFIRFDLSTLPAVAIISSTTFSLKIEVDASANARDVRVFRTKRVFVEGDGTGGSGVTWNKYDGSNAWSTAGGFGAADCEQTDIGYTNVGVDESVNSWIDWSLTATAKTDLDYGLENAGSATGWLVKADTEDTDQYQYYSSDHGTAANRPKLVVDYTLAGGDAPFSRIFAPGFRGVMG